MWSYKEDKISRIYRKGNMYDIIGFSETKLNEEKVEAVDTVSIEHFTLFHKFRHHKNPSRSGGLCVAMKQLHSRES